MKNSHLLAALLLALPLAAAAQTKTTTAPTKTTTPTAVPPGMQPQTEVTEDLDPATGKVIRRTTRTVYVPVGTSAPAGGGGSTSSSASTSGTATDAQVTDFFREQTKVSSLTGPALLDAYQRFIEQVRAERHGWKPADWAAASAVLSRLNSRYDQLRSTYTLDEKVTIRSQQAEFQALRTGRQLSDQVSDKL